MKIARIIPLLGVLARTAAIRYGLTAGDSASEGGRLASLPWGIVSM
jgi:hypothetical protein